MDMESFVLHPTQPDPTQQLTDPIQPIIQAHGPIQPTHLTAKHIETAVFNPAGAQYVIYCFDKF